MFLVFFFSPVQIAAYLYSYDYHWAFAYFGYDLEASFQVPSGEIATFLTAVLGRWRGHGGVRSRPPPDEPAGVYLCVCVWFVIVDAAT